ncbi:metal ABC transporter ATP-binding protein [candidate division KSB1 bacterium]|nr:metal ABC transporter ATP-binding protein [candidate division KSB1 bacterium]
MTGNPTISVQDVSVRYGENLVLDRIQFDVNPHEIVSIVGPNGSGKTTLIHTILGLIEPFHGTVRVFEKSPQSARSRGQIGFLPQAIGTDLQFPVSAFDVVALAVSSHKRMFRPLSQNDRARVLEALQKVQMEKSAQLHFGSLSGGEKQRVLIARALAVHPKLLILDEPSTGLDIVAQESFYKLLQYLRDEEGLTILFVSHDIGAVSGVVDRIACLNRKIHFHGKPSDCIPSEALEAVFGKDVQFVYHDRHCHTCGEDS